LKESPLFCQYISRAFRSGDQIRLVQPGFIESDFVKRTVLLFGKRCILSFSTVVSAATEGLAVEFVHVEADVSNGLPVFHMVGYLASEVKEAGERVRTAIKNSGFDFPAKRTVINLSPATMRKRGASFDLPIAVAVLTALGELSGSRIQNTLIIGEMGLDGSVRKVPGILPIVAEAKEREVRRCIVPEENKAEAALVSGMQVIGVKDLKETIEFLKSGSKPQKKKVQQTGSMQERETEESFPDFGDLCGQKNVRRAAEIAVAGGHNLLLIGPPGSGKTMTAGCIAGILPPMSTEESMEVTKIYSVMGMVDEKQPLIRKRPFRNVHHTATRAALIGGGMIPRPGEISLAHQGVLFLDELPEFKKGVLEVLRQPLEQHCIRITRNYGTYTFPADFMLVAAMNPCPCGCYPNLERCTCTPAQIQAYLGKISQPFLDRIDLCVEAGRVDYENLTEQKKGEASAEIRMRVCRVRNLQKERYEGKKIRRNTQLEGELLKKYCALGTKEEAMMRQAFERFSLTARSYHRILRVARTIADLDGREKISEEHLSEALGYRMVDKKYWGR
jgi:magnesium chelatase family protein